MLFLKINNKKLFKYFKHSFNYYSSFSFKIMSEKDCKVINEGQAKITTSGKVFYNPVQEFNRDLSIAVLSTFAHLYAEERKIAKKIKEGIKVENSKNQFIAGTKYENGLYILEALSATGLRTVRYAKEVCGVKSIIANDISARAHEDIKKNISNNNVQDLAVASLNDASMLMYEHRKDQFDVIDLDPYGCPSIFLDSAVQSIKDGGLLLVTATDMAVLAGNAPETCYSKYGAVSLRIKSCHEMALRILLQCIEGHANRYGRYIVPMLSISADFYIRVFVRVFSGPNKCKYTTSKLSMVYHCISCDSFKLQPLGAVQKNEKNNQVKFTLPKMVATTGGTVCEHCKHSIHLGGPIWSAPIHNKDFIAQVLENSVSLGTLGTHRRIEGILNMCLEELDVPLYYTLEKLTSTLHCEMPSMLAIRSAFLNAKYKVSYSHAHKTSIKTDAPADVVWDVMRSWVFDEPVSERWLEAGTVSGNILRTPRKMQHGFWMHDDANPKSRKSGFLRFQENPLPHWGPGCRSQVMTDFQNEKKTRNQGKRKRPTNDGSESNDSENVESDIK